MAIIGQGIDRVDGRLKVAGRAHYAAEFAVPNVVHALLVQSPDRHRNDHRLRPRCGACDAGRSRDYHSGQRAEAAYQGRAATDGALAVVAGPCDYLNGQHVAIVVAQTLDQADAAAAQVRVRYRRDEPVTSMDAVLARLSAEEIPQRRTPARFASRRSRCGVRHRGGEGRCHLRHADGTSQSDGTSRDDRAVGRQSADCMDHDTGYLRDAANPRRIVRYRRVGCARDLPLSRRRLRLQGQHVAAGDARRDGS